ncbi:MAG: hypothetical protein JXA20_10170 [Spirochaetes bacterium]|nr:hypothetical protein [Spirochaetota bacterium]
MEMMRERYRGFREKLRGYNRSQRRFLGGVVFLILVNAAIIVLSGVIMFMLLARL